MGLALVAVVGTLLGAIIGASGTYYSQSRQQQRDARERLGTLKRELGVVWLGKLHETYTSVRDAVRTYHASKATLDETRRAVRAVRPGSAQNALEALRLVVGDAVATAAANQWRHMRKAPVPLGHELDKDAWDKWQAQYYELRRAFTDAVRQESGLPPLDWATAGVNR